MLFNPSLIKKTLGFNTTTAKKFKYIKVSKLNEHLKLAFKQFAKNYPVIDLFSNKTLQNFGTFIIDISNETFILMSESSCLHFETINYTIWQNSFNICTALNIVTKDSKQNFSSFRLNKTLSLCSAQRKLYSDKTLLALKDIPI